MKMITLVPCILLFSLSQVSFALTVEEVIKLKKEGVSDETIQLMIRQQMQGERLSDPYKNMGVKEIKKKADGKSSTIYSTGEIEDEGAFEEERKREEKAWQMLDNVLIDTRNGQKDNEKNINEAK